MCTVESWSAECCVECVYMKLLSLGCCALYVECVLHPILGSMYPVCEGVVVLQDMLYVLY